MAEELPEQIKAVEAEIASTTLEIDEVKAELKLVAAQLADGNLSPEWRAEQVEERRRLGKKEEQLRSDKQQLRTKEELLRSAALPPGAVRCFPAELLGQVPAYRHDLAYLVADPGADAKAAGFAGSRFEAPTSTAHGSVSYSRRSSAVDIRRRTRPMKHCRHQWPPWIGCSAWVCLICFRRAAVAGGASGAGGSGICGISAHLTAWPNASPLGSVRLSDIQPLIPSDI